MGTGGPIVYINRIQIRIESWVQCGFRQSIVFHSTGADGEAPCQGPWSTPTDYVRHVLFTARRKWSHMGGVSG